MGESSGFTGNTNKSRFFDLMVLQNPEHIWDGINLDGCAKPTGNERERAFRAQMRRKEPPEYGNDEVPIPVYVLEIYQDTFGKRSQW